MDWIQPFSPIFHLESQLSKWGQMRSDSQAWIQTIFIWKWKPTVLIGSDHVPGLLFDPFASLIPSLQTVSDEIMLSAQILIINPMVGGWDQVSLFCIFYTSGGAWLISKQFPPQVTNQQYYLISSWSFQSKLIVVYLLTFFNISS